MFFISPQEMATERFTSSNFVWKIIQIYIAMFVARSLYYVGWKLTDTAIILSGISYDG